MLVKGGPDIISTICGNCLRMGSDVCLKYDIAFLFTQGLCGQSADLMYFP